MTDAHNAAVAERDEPPPKTRTWWHPLLARILDHLLATAYSVVEEVLVGKLPLRVDILLIRRAEGQLSEAAQRDLSPLVPLLNRFTLIEFKGPTDALETGDLAQLAGCAFLWHSQQAAGISHEEVSLVVLAPRMTEAFRSDLPRLGCEAGERERGVFHIAGLPFTTWLVETDLMADQGQPILSLVSHVFLEDHARIIEQLKPAHAALLYYVLQQIQQFRHLGEEFAMQHKDSEYLGELEEELQTAVLEAIPPERRLRGLAPEERLRGLPPEERLRGLPPEERLRGLPPEERLRGLPPEERLKGLSQEELAHLRELLEREQSG